MKRKISTVLAAALMISSVSSPVFAAGVPTIDIGTITQLQEAVRQAKAQLGQLERQYDQTRDQFKQAQNWNIGNAWSSIEDSLPSVGDLLPDDITDIAHMDVSSLRSQYGMESSNSDTQKLYDDQLRTVAIDQKGYQVQKVHLDRLQRLSDRARRATTPQERDEIRNALAHEQQSMSIDDQKLAVARKQTEENQKLENTRQNAELNQVFGLSPNA